MVRSGVIEILGLHLIELLRLRLESLRSNIGPDKDYAFVKAQILPGYILRLAFGGDCRNSWLISQGREFLSVTNHLTNGKS